MLCCISGCLKPGDKQLVADNQLSKQNNSEIYKGRICTCLSVSVWMVLVSCWSFQQPGTAVGNQPRWGVGQLWMMPSDGISRWFSQDGSQGARTDNILLDLSTLLENRYTGIPQFIFHHFVGRKIQTFNFWILLNFVYPSPGFFFLLCKKIHFLFECEINNIFQRGRVSLYLWHYDEIQIAQDGGFSSISILRFPHPDFERTNSGVREMTTGKWEREMGSGTF